MALFTSSSKPSRSTERSAIILIVAACLWLIATLANTILPDPKFTEAQTSDWFWMSKVHGHAPSSINIVLSGDSRLYRGLSPAIFDQALPGLKTLNFGFSSGGHNPVIFSEINTLLAPVPAPRAVVLGITPYSLTKRAQANAQFLDFKTRHGAPVPPGKNIETILRPMDWDRAHDLITGEAVTYKSPDTNDYQADGWVRSDWAKRDPQYALSSYQHIFDNNPVDPQVIDGILRQTQEWTAQGITVVAYAPPTTPDMVALERSKSGFDQKSFAAAFRKAGGLWIDLTGDFETFDGSHLTPESAEKLSKILAASIAGRIQNP